MSKSVSEISGADLEKHPVWRHKRAETLGAGEDETWVEPVTALPVRDAYSHFFGVRVELSDGTKELVFIGNTEPQNPSYNREHQIFISFRQGRRHVWTDDPLSRGKPEHDPEALAMFLGKQRSAVFPFRYDLSAYLIGHAEVLARAVTPTEPTGGTPMDPVQAMMEAARRHLKNNKPGP